MCVDDYHGGRISQSASRAIALRHYQLSVGFLSALIYKQTWPFSRQSMLTRFSVKLTVAGFNDDVWAKKSNFHPSSGIENFFLPWFAKLLLWQKQTFASTRQQHSSSVSMGTWPLDLFIKPLSSFVCAPANARWMKHEISLSSIYSRERVNEAGKLKRKWKSVKNISISKQPEMWKCENINQLSTEIRQFPQFCFAKCKLPS